ncbi:hypothetical protein M5689_011972 [Euphorbia peplus]|nr:hypothetical protein M5689_011972 [Euphorbia peplus]
MLDQPGKKRPIAPSDDEPSSKLQELGNEMQKDPSETSKTTLLSNKESKNNIITIESAISALQVIPDIDDDLLFDVCHLLEDNKQAKMFFYVRVPFLSVSIFV